MKSVGTLYDRSDMNFLREFKLLLAGGKDWKKLGTKDGIRIDYLTSGKDNVPVARSVIELNYFVDPVLYFNQMIRDKHIIGKFYGSIRRESDLIHEFNPINRISQFQVAVNSCIAADRDFLTQEILFFVTSDDTLLHYSGIKDDISKYPKHKIIYLLRSMTDRHNKHFRKQSNHDARGRMYRTGICVENDIKKNKSTISVIMEFKLGGDNLVQYFGNTYGKTCTESHRYYVKVQEMLFEC